MLASKFNSLLKLTVITTAVFSSLFFASTYKLPGLKVNAQSLENPEVIAEGSAVGGSLQDQLTDVQKKLGNLTKQKQDLQNAINAEKNKQGSYNSEIRKVQNERALLQAEIDEKRLVIDELTLQIEILNRTIIDTEKVVEKTQKDIVKLEIDADEQLADMYFDLKTANTALDAIFADGSTSIVKTGLYQETIQANTNNALLNLKLQNDKLKADKKQLEEDKIKVVADKGKMDQEKIELDKKQGELTAKQSRLNQLWAEAQKSVNSNKEALASLSDQEAKLLADQELLQQRIFSQTGTITTGQYVKRGTIIGFQGLTGLTTGYHLHFGVQVNGAYQNPCGYLPAGRFSFCAGNGYLSWPMQGSYVFTSGYGYRSLGGSSSFHAAIDLAHPTQNAAIYAAHDGWIKRGFEPCNPAYYLCKNGGANYAIICENKTNCNSGIKTMYWHLK